ncbi:hypothetical protein [Haladaptatus sp. CMAA 1911]|uniref:hypothetical protein n=1 Tax=unclassified Haladaptatus TaxID=2622732 RepID=UPI0037540416
MVVESLFDESEVCLLSDVFAVDGTVVASVSLIVPPLLVVVAVLSDVISGVVSLVCVLVVIVSFSIVPNDEHPAPRAIIITAIIVIF